MYGVIELFWIAVLVFLEPFQALKIHVHPKKLHNYMTKRDLSRYFGVESHDDVPEYDVVHPVQVDSQGNYLTHHLKGVFRRSTDAAKMDTSKLHYKLNAFGEDLHLILKKNHALMAPNFKSNVLGENGKVLRSRKLKNCHYHGRTKSHETSKVAISNCKGLTGLIKTPKSAYFIEPIPEHLKGMLKPNGGKQPHLIFKNHGYQKRKRINSDPRVKEEPHVVNFCGTKDNSSIKLNPFFHDVIGEKRAALPTANKGGSSKNIEAYLVIDQKMANFHGLDNVEQFALSAVNIAAKVLVDYTIGQFPAKYSLVKMSILTAPQIGLVINHHATNTLNSLGEWAGKQNKVDDNDPDHFDHVTLFTRYNICADSDQPCDTLGLAPLSGMCSFPSSATVNQDNGLLVGLTLAHETGHNLGMNHDYIGGCPDRVNIMATSASGKESAFEWSSCSRNFFGTFLKLEQATCLNDEPQKRVKDLDQLEKPGVLYNADTQCSDTFGQGSKFCNVSEKYVQRMCFQMWCKMPDNPMSCSTVFEPAAEGTKCGEKKWCKRGVCADKSAEPPKAVDGGWSKWSEFSDCSRTCDGGIQIRGRTCNSPQPQKGGKDCEGESTEHKLCNVNACPPQSEDFLNIQCKEKNAKIFGDTKYKWEYHPSDLSNPCELGCFIEKSDKGYAMGPVKDGTTCITTTVKGKCINGVCRQLGCDGVIDSSAKPDRCGVCNGDGSSCAGKGKYFKYAKYLDGIPKNKQFTWMTVVSNCSVPCAGGMLANTSECRRVDDNSFVGESFCNAGEKPAKKELQCNTQPCPPTWHVDDWEDCSKTCSSGVRRRNVKCVQVVKENTEEEIEEGICSKAAGQKPLDLEECNAFPCEAEWIAKNFGKCTTTCGEGVRERAVVCIRPSNNGQNLQVPETQCTGVVKPFDKEKCNEDKPCPGQDGCGGTFSDARGKLSSPGFPSDYPNEQDCVYSISVQPGSKIKVSFDSFKIDSADEPEGQQKCTDDRLELYDGNCASTEVAAVTKYCGGNKPDPYLSTANQLCMKFISDAAQSASGFTANYVACTGKCDGTEAPLPSAPGVAAGQPTPGLTPITGAPTPFTGAQPKPGLNDVIGKLHPIKSFNSETSISSPRENESPVDPLGDGELTASPPGGSEAFTDSPSGDVTGIGNPLENTGVLTDPLRDGAAIENPERVPEAPAIYLEDDAIRSSPSAESQLPLNSSEAALSNPSLTQQETTSKLKSPSDESNQVYTDDIKLLETAQNDPGLEQTSVPTQPTLLRERPKTSDSSLRQTTVTPDDDVEDDDDDDSDDDEMNEDDEQDKNTKTDLPKGITGTMVRVLKKDHSARPSDKP